MVLNPPTMLSIPAIGVHADVIQLGLNSDHTLQVPTDFGQVGWWEGGTPPGGIGPAVLVGHIDSHTGPAVFARLAELQPGDAIDVQGPAGAMQFRVQRLERHAKTSFPTADVYGPTPAPTLRLITCGGQFDRAARSYVDNLIVYADLEPRPVVDPAPPPRLPGHDIVNMR